jgi:hypothetical protein
MPFTIDSARNIFPNTLTADGVPATIARFNQLSAEDQLALIWFAYLEMGKTITVAALGAASMQLADLTLQEILKLDFAGQTQVMGDLANRSDTPLCRTYSTWSPNIKLGFWYQLGKWMDEGKVAPIPADYKPSANASAVLQAIRQLEAGQQITVLRNCVVDMGYDTAKMGDYKRVSEPFVPPQAVAQRSKVSIEGVSNATVLSYMDNLNANDFDALRFFREECLNLSLIPERGVSEPAEDGFTQIKVTGKVQTPWFGGGVGMNMSWRFLLNQEGKIFFVAIDLLASPKELLNFAR